MTEWINQDVLFKLLSITQARLDALLEEGALPRARWNGEATLRIRAGELRHTVAGHLVRERLGFRGKDVKGRAAALVRAWKKWKAGCFKIPVV